MLDTVQIFEFLLNSLFLLEIAEEASQNVIFISFQCLVEYMLLLNRLSIH